MATSREMEPVWDGQAELLTLSPRQEGHFPVKSEMVHPFSSTQTHNQKTTLQIFPPNHGPLSGCSGPSLALGIHNRP